jgi:hypothetical protein
MALSMAVMTDAKPPFVVCIILYLVLIRTLVGIAPNNA